jgi:hypothetical protein
MTKAEWLACEEPDAMLEFMGSKVTDRKLRLLAHSVQYNCWQDFSDARIRAALGVSERFADGLATEEELDKATDDAKEAFHAAVNLYNRVDGRVQAFQLALWAVFPGRAHNKGAILWTGDQITAIALLRDIFPFRPITLSPSWLTSTVVSLAQQMYDTRDFSAMPILADALQDAGCENEEVLNHCRGSGPHVRGCWVLDLLTNRE